MEYEFEEIPSGRGFFVGKSLGHRETILRRAAEGWRYCGWIPSQQMDGAVILMDLIFEREKEGQA